MKTIVTLFFACMLASVTGQKLSKGKNYYISAIGFWNVENLYDTLNDQWKNDEDFTPGGSYAWNGVRYREKIKRLSEAIAGMATDATPDGLAILGMCEVENRSVVEDLVNAPALKPRNYKVIHIEGPDIRGVDPSFIYNPSYFKPLKQVAYRVTLVRDPDHKTRDILVVSGLFCGEPLSVLVNHWPSRRGGELASRPDRNAAAALARRIADSIMAIEPNSKILIMGDLNDDPVNECVKKHIRSNGDLHATGADEFFNPMEKLYLEGTGTLAWQDSWNLFDQIMLNSKWIPAKYETWQYYRVRVYNKAFLKADFGNYKGYPLRTYSGGVYTAGYSDHFPVYIVIAKEKK